MSDMIARFAEARNRRMALATAGLRLQQSPFLAKGLSQTGNLLLNLVKTPLIASSGISIDAVLPAGSATPEERIFGWAPTQAMVLMTEHWMNMHPEFKKLEEERRYSYLMGAITCYSIITPDELERAGILAARDSMIRTLKSRIPPRSLMNNVLKSVRESILIRDSMVKDWVKVGLIHFPWRLWTISRDDFVDWVNEVLLRPANDSVGEIPALMLEVINTAENMVPKEQEILATEWNSITSEEMASFYNHASLNDPTPNRILAAALFTSSATIAKNSWTDAWLTSRLDRLEQELPGINDESIITVELLRNYALTFQPDPTKSHLIYNAILYNYAVASTSGLTSIKWILEQSRAANVSALMGLSETMTTHPILTSTILENQFGVNQIQAAARLAIGIIYNPWASITSPQIAMSQYPDLAYLGLRLSSIMMNRARGRKSAYGGSPDANSVKGKMYLDTFADSILDLSVKSGKAALSIESILACYGRTVVADGDRGWRVIPRGAQPAQDPNVEGNPAAPADANSVTFSHDTFDSWFRSNLYSDRDRAFNLIMGALRTAASQMALPEIAITGTNATVNHLYTIPLSEEVKNAASVLGIVAPELTIQDAVSLSKTNDDELPYKLSDMYIYELDGRNVNHGDDHHDENPPPGAPRQAPAADHYDQAELEGAIGGIRDPDEPVPDRWDGDE